MRPDQVAQRVAARQHGVVTRLQALAAGLSDAAIRHRCATGRWKRVGPEVYVIGGAPATWEQLVSVAVLAVEGSCASHLTAARLWSVVDGDPERVHVTVSYGTRQRRLAGVTVHSAKRLDARDVRVVDGIRTACPARTLVDIAGQTSDRLLARALDRALLSGITSVAVVRRYVAARGLATNKGVGKLTRLLEDHTAGVPEGDMERAFLGIVRRYRLPPPARQHRVGRFRLDYAYPDVLVAIELDDVGSHGTPGGLQSDLRRQNELVLLGWTVFRFTWADVTKEPAKVAGTIRAALRRTPFSS